MNKNICLIKWLGLFIFCNILLVVNVKATESVQFNLATNFSKDELASVKGLVELESTANPCVTCTISVYKEVVNKEDEWFTDKHADQKGNFTIELPNGKYKLEIETADGDLKSKSIHIIVKDKEVRLSNGEITVEIKTKVESFSLENAKPSNNNHDINNTPQPDLQKSNKTKLGSVENQDNPPDNNNRVDEPKVPDMNTSTTVSKAKAPTVGRGKPNLGYHRGKLQAE